MRVFTTWLDHGELFACGDCGTHLSRVELLESKHFKGKTGPAYLMTHVWNLAHGPAVDRHLLTGDHTIQEVYCAVCEANVGWTYLHAEDERQQYKIGKFILEKALICRIVTGPPDAIAPSASASASASASSD